ncbi:MAG: ParA family protein, partial [bacterium]
LGPLVSAFDYTLIDCPPGLGILLINALVAATHVLIPVPPRFVDSRGLSSLLDAIDRVRETFNPGLKILGILPTMIRRRSRHGDEMREILEEHFGALLIEPGIPDTVAFWASSATLSSILTSEPESPGAAAYRAVAKEVIARAEADGQSRRR